METERVAMPRKPYPATENERVFGRWLQQTVKEIDWSVNELEARTKIDKGTLSHYMHARRRLNPNHQESIFSALDTHAAEQHLDLDIASARQLLSPPIQTPPRRVISSTRTDWLQIGRNARAAGQHDRAAIAFANGIRSVAGGTAPDLEALLYAEAFWTAHERENLIDEAAFRLEAGKRLKALLGVDTVWSDIAIERAEKEGTGNMLIEAYWRLAHAEVRNAEKYRSFARGRQAARYLIKVAQHTGDGLAEAYHARGRLAWVEGGGFNPRDLDEAVIYREAVNIERLQYGARDFDLALKNRTLTDISGIAHDYRLKTNIEYLLADDRRAASSEVQALSYAAGRPALSNVELHRARRLALAEPARLSDTLDILYDALAIGLTVDSLSVVSTVLAEIGILRSNVLGDRQTAIRSLIAAMYLWPGHATNLDFVRMVYVARVLLNVYDKPLPNFSVERFATTDASPFDLVLVMDRQTDSYRQRRIRYLARYLSGGVAWQPLERPTSSGMAAVEV